MKVCYST